VSAAASESPVTNASPPLATRVANTLDEHILKHLPARLACIAISPYFFSQNVFFLNRGRFLPRIRDDQKFPRRMLYGLGRVLYGLGQLRKSCNREY
jgi:hypothetical protein